MALPYQISHDPTRSGGIHWNTLALIKANSHQNCLHRPPVQMREAATLDWSNNAIVLDCAPLNRWAPTTPRSVALRHQQQSTNKFSQGPYGLYTKPEYGPRLFAFSPKKKTLLETCGLRTGGLVLSSSQKRSARSDRKTSQEDIMIDWLEKIVAADGKKY